VATHVAPWDVAGYLLNLVGSGLDANTVKAEVSFDGVSYHTIDLSKTFVVIDSAAPGVRSLRVTLYNLGSMRPIVASMVEIFDEDGVELENRVIIRYDSPNIVKALYVDRDGNISLSASVEPSTSDKCLLHKITPAGSAAPAIKNYINRRRPHIKYTGTKSADPNSVKFDNELAVPVRYVDARASKGSDASMYKIADPAVALTPWSLSPAWPQTAMAGSSSLRPSKASGVHRSKRWTPT
jgi:hypothetical protein